MIARDIATLYDFDQVEPKLTEIIEANLTLAGVSVRKRRDADQLKLPRVEVDLQVGGATSGRKIYNDQQYLNAYNAVLKITILTARRRDNEPPDLTSHRLLVCQLRRFLQVAERYFALNVFPYHSFAKVIESGTRRGNEQDEGGRDWTELSFAIVLGIRNDSWPEVSMEQAFGLSTESGDVLLTESGEVIVPDE